MTPDWKSPRRIVATPEDWEELRRAKLGGCRVCGKENAGRLAMRPTRWWNGSGLESTLHHLVSKSLGGDDIADNLVPLCGSGTTGCHGLVEVHHPSTCRALADNLSSREIEYVERKKPGYIERRYRRRIAA